MLRVVGARRAVQPSATNIGFCQEVRVPPSKLTLCGRILNSKGCRGRAGVHPRQWIPHCIAGASATLGWILKHLRAARVELGSIPCSGSHTALLEPQRLLNFEGCKGRVGVYPMQWTTHCIAGASATLGWILKHLRAARAESGSIPGSGSHNALLEPQHPSCCTVWMVTCH